MIQVKKPVTGPQIKPAPRKRRKKPPPERAWETAMGCDVAEYCGVTRAHISMIMTGRRNPSFDIAKLMADFHMISMDDLYERLKDRPSLVA